METQTKQTREKEGLLSKIAEAGKIILNAEVASNFGLGWSINFDGYNGIRDTYRHVKHIFKSNKLNEVTPEREEYVKTLFEGTPFYSVLKEQDAFYREYGDNRSCWERGSLTQLAESLRAGNFSKALRLVKKPINSSYVTGRDAILPIYSNESSFFIGNDWRKYSGGSVSKTEALIFTDLAIIAGRLAKKLGKNPSKYYELANTALNDASSNLGGIVVHFGRGVSGLSDASQLISQRKQIIEKEFGGHS